MLNAPIHESAAYAQETALTFGGTTLGMVWQLIVFLAATVFVLFLAYYSLRLLGGAKGIRKSGNISIIEAINVGFQNNVALIRAGEQYFLIGVSRGRVTLIGEIDSTTVKEAEGFGYALHQNIPFENHLKKFFKKGADEGNDDGESNDESKKNK